MSSGTLSGAEKSAILLLSLPEQSARALLEQMGEAETERVLEAVSRLERVPVEKQVEVLEEFRTRALGERGGVRGGPDRTLQILEKLVPDPHAERLRARIQRAEAPIPYVLHRHTPAFIAAVVSHEDAQTIALVISQLTVKRGSAVLLALPEALRPEVVRRLATLEPVAAEVLADVARGLEDLLSEQEQAKSAAAGVAAAAELLSQIGRAEGDSVLEALQERDEAVAEEIRRSMLTFDHLAQIDDPGFKKLLQNVPMEDLVLALKTASQAMRDKIFGNLATRAREALREEEEMLGPRRLSEVEAKQREIVDIARRLADQGEIVLGAASGESYV